MSESAGNDNAIPSSIASWLKSVGLGGARPDQAGGLAAANDLKKRKKGDGGSDGARAGGGAAAAALPWSLGDSLIAFVLLGCVVAWAASYFLAHRVQ